MKKMISAAAILFLAAVIFSRCYVPAADDGEGPTGRLGISIVSGSKVIAGSGTIRISGSGMGTITVPILPGEKSKTVEVPAGKDRRVELRIDGASASIGGSVNVNVTEDTETVATLPLSLVSSRIIVPDKENNRIVQIDEMDGAGWTTADYSKFPGSPSYWDFYPTDIEFDNQGRVYISNTYSSIIPGIVRIPDILGTDAAEPILPINNHVECMALDRVNNFLYFHNNGPVSRIDLNSVTFPVTTIFDPTVEGVDAYDIMGLAVDDDGNLYISVYLYAFSSYGIIKFNPFLPEGTRLLNIRQIPIQPNSLHYIPPLLYAGYNTFGEAAVQTFLKDLTPAESFGVVNYGSNAGEFFGARKMVAIFRRRLYILDCTSSDSRIVSLDPDSLPSGWVTYGKYGDAGAGTGFFWFFFC